MGCHFLLQGIFPTQGWNPYFLCLLHDRQILYPLSSWEAHLTILPLFFGSASFVWATLVVQFCLCNSSNRSGLVTSFSNLEGKDFIQQESRGCLHCSGLDPMHTQALTATPGGEDVSQPHGLRTEVPTKENWGVLSRNTWKWMPVRNKSREPLESISPFYRWKTWGLEMVKVLTQEMEQPSLRIWSQVYVQLDLCCFFFFLTLAKKGIYWFT